MPENKEKGVNTDTKNAGELAKALNDMLPPQRDYAEMVASPVPSSYGCCYVWEDPNDYVIYDASIMLLFQQSRITSLEQQLAAAERRAKDARNELCLKCGRYHEAHNGACDGCRWKED